MQCFIANILPVRPNPVWTSSAISTIPFSSQTRRSACINSGGTGWKPPSPCTGSIMIAATRDGSTQTLCGVGFTRLYLRIAVAPETDRFVELDEVRRELAGFYSHLGRPSIDAELMIRILMRSHVLSVKMSIMRNLAQRIHSEATTEP